MRNWVAGVVLCVLASTAMAATKSPAPPKTGEVKPKTDIRVVEFGKGTELKWTGVQQPDLEIPLTIANRGTAKVENISVHLTPFQGSGRTAEPSLDPSAPFALDKHAETTVKIKVKLPAAAVYRAQLRIDAGDTSPFEGTIDVERKFAKAPLVIASTPAKVETALCAVDESFDVNVRTTGDTVTLAAPTLLGVTRKESAKSTVAAQPPSVTLKADKNPFQVNADNKTLQLTLTGLRHAGLYEAKVRLGGDGYDDTVVPLTVYVREPWWIALILIAAGVLLSFFIRSYTSVLRPRLLNERRVATLFNELSEHATLAGNDAGALSMVQNVRRALTVRYNELASLGQLTAADSFDVYDAKVALLPRWITLRKRVADLKPDTLRAPFEARLVTAAQTLANDGANKTAVEAKLADLDEMPVDIDVELKKEIVKQLADFKKDLQNDKRPEVQLILQVAAALDTAVTQDQLPLPEAAAQLDTLRRQYVRLLADELSTRLSATPPIGVDGRDWPAILSTITSGLAYARSAPTAAEATDAFRSALALFLNTALGGFQTHLQNRVDQTKAKEAYVPVQALVTKIAAAIAAGDLMTAWKMLADAEAQYRAIISATTANLGADAAGMDALRTMSAPAASAAQTWDISSIFGFGRSSDKLAASGSMKTIDESIRRTDLIITAVILAIAVLTGLKTLWVDDLTWGGLLSYLAAFLWGVGFDQFSHAGLVTLLNKR